MRAWIFALSNEAEARTRLTEALAEGADPWVKTAVIRQWQSGSSLTLHEAVLAGKETLSAEETVARLSLLALYSRAEQNAQEHRVLTRLVRIGLTETFPMPLLERWAGLSRNPAQWAGLLPLVVERSVANAEWGKNALPWAHRTIAPVQSWSPILLQTLERTESPEVRDTYWALQRAPEIRPRPAASGRR